MVRQRTQIQIPDHKNTLSSFDIFIELLFTLSYQYMFPLNVNVQLCAISLTIVTIHGMKTNTVIHYHNEPLWYHNGYIQCCNHGCYVYNNNKYQHWSHGTQTLVTHGSLAYSMCASVSKTMSCIYYSNVFTAVIYLYSLS